MKMFNILLLTDYRNAFYSSTKNTKTLCTMDVEKIHTGLTERGFDVTVQGFSEVDFSLDYSDTAVIFTSSEDYGLTYRSYIEDVMLALKNKGALLIPDFIFLRAHHNKSFMEMLRMTILPEQAKIVNTHVFGTYEEFKKTKLSEGKYVIKSAFGAGSNGVTMANNIAELDKKVRKISRNFSLAVVLKEIKKRILWGSKYHKASIHNKKYIVQNFVDGLSGDYKVLRYGKRFYSLYRENRENDFRASGGGKLTYNLPSELSETKLLSFAKQMSDKIGTPLCSLDIAWDGKKFILIEFQCLCFGPYTAEHSDHYYSYENEDWKRYDETCDLEAVFCDAIKEYLEKC